MSARLVLTLHVRAAASLAQNRCLSAPAERREVNLRQRGLGQRNQPVKAVGEHSEHLIC